MNKQIVALRRLQEQDRKLLRLEQRAHRIPKQLEILDQDLKQLEELLGGELSKLESSRVFRGKQEVQLREEEEAIRNSKTRLNAVKTPREAAAVQREVDSTKRMSQARTQEITNITEGIDKAESAIADMQLQLDDLREKANVERVRLIDEQSKIEGAVGKTRGSRDTLIADVERNVFRRYERLRTRARGLAFVPMHEQRCTECKLQVPHQTQAELRKGEEIIDCENCGRLMYWAGHFQDEVERLTRGTAQKDG